MAHAARPRLELVRRESLTRRAARLDVERVLLRVEDVRLDGAELARVVELVEVEAGHLVLVLVVERRARRADREQLAERRLERALPAHVEVSVEEEPAMQAGELGDRGRRRPTRPFMNVFILEGGLWIG